MKNNKKKYLKRMFIIPLKQDTLFLVLLFPLKIITRLEEKKNCRMSLNRENEKRDGNLTFFFNYLFSS